MAIRAEIEYYRSATDGNLYPYIVSASDASTELKPLLLEVSPGGTDLKRGIGIVEEIALIAENESIPCIVARPTGRGPGSVYQNYGEVDVLETIKALSSRYPVDPDRVSVTGSSMGGAATWYLASHYPDLFSAAAPVCGYCDYRLWEKPGGYTFHMHPWEEASWMARSAVFFPENFIHTPLWIVHGSRDRAVGGGVPVEHSRRMAAVLENLGYQFTYTEVPGVGHCADRPDRLIPWMLKQRKTRNPGRVVFSTFELRHSSSYWLTVEQIERYGEKACIDASFAFGNDLGITSDNIRAFTVDRSLESGITQVTVDGQDLGSMDLSMSLTFIKRDSGSWERTFEGFVGQKTRNSSGPIGDLFHHGLVLVPGTSGTEEESFYNMWLARNSVGYFKKRNGGVHRGGILGETSVELPIAADVEASEDMLQSKNLLLFGTFASNSALEKFQGRIPLKFGIETIDLCGRIFQDKHAAVFAIFPHPDNDERYVAVHGGLAPDAICWGSHLDMLLLPDFIVYSKGAIIEWGFWDNDWQQPARNTGDIVND